MKLRHVLVTSALVLSFLTGLTTNTAKAASRVTVHTLDLTRLYAKGSVLDNGLGDPKFDFSLVGNRGLAPNTDWYSDQTQDGQDASYRRVATNEWVDLSKVVLINHSDTTYPLDIQKSSRIYQFDKNTYSMTATDKNLAAGSWKTTGFMTFPNQPSYYQVATNEWIQIL